MPRPVQYALLGVALVATGTMVWQALQPAPVPRDSSVRLEESTPPPVTRAVVEAYIIGDSITAGGPPGKGWSYGYTIQKLLNWSVTIDGEGATGFVSKGPEPEEGSTPAVDRSFPTRLGDIIAADPDVVIVAGGRNDIYTGRANVAATINTFYRDLRAQLPNAQIVTISPWLWDTTSEQKFAEGVDDVTSITRTATEAVGGLFIDSREVFTPITDADLDILLLEDRFHPNDKGQAQIGSELTRVLVAGGLPRGPELWRERSAFSNDWYDTTDKFFADGALPAAP